MLVGKEPFTNTYTRATRSGLIGKQNIDESACITDNTTRAVAHWRNK